MSGTAAHYLDYAVAIVLCVAGVAFFAGSETAFVSSNRLRVRGMARRGVRGARVALALFDRQNTLLSATLVGTNILVVLASSLATQLFGELVGTYAVAASTASVTAVMLVFGEMLPKALARFRPESFLVRAAHGLNIAYHLLFPLAKATSTVATLTLRVPPSKRAGVVVTRDEIRALVKEAARTGYGYRKDSYAHRALDLSRMKVTSVMLPMDDVVCVDSESTVAEALATASKSGHSRYPVYKATPENLVGILHVKDLLGVRGSSKVNVFARKGHFVPETMTVKQAIVDMRDDLRHMGIVADEYGRALGILTFEDLIEEIVGEISDEYDGVRGHRLQFGRMMSGGTPISVLNEELEIDIPEGDYETIAGFILAQRGSIPAAGDIIEHAGVRFEVAEVKGKRIKSVKITRQEN